MKKIVLILTFITFGVIINQSCKKDNTLKNNLTGTKWKYEKQYTNNLYITYEEEVLNFTSTTRGYSDYHIEYNTSDGNENYDGSKNFTYDYQDFNGAIYFDNTDGGREFIINGNELKITHNGTTNIFYKL